MMVESVVIVSDGCENDKIEKLLITISKKHFITFI